MAATATIFHHPDAVESAEKPLAGRRAAGQSFLAGYVAHVEADALHTTGKTPGHVDHFRQLVTEYGWKGKVEGALLHDGEKLGEPGTLFLPGPNLGPFAWTRRRAGQSQYALCGITHTVSTQRIMQGLFDVLVSPVESWDAVICTSKAVHDVVEGELDAAEHFLQRRFAARRVPRPQLPVIPLGIHTDRFTPQDGDRARWRAKYELADDDIAVMSIGRLSFAEKLHPAPLFQALQLAAKRTGKRIVMLMVGWFGDQPTEKLHRECAEFFAPDVEVLFPDGKDQDLRFSIWAGADIFTLPVDNIQETFGLAPVEAMAAGLPVVCSDWNGFKDTIVDGETGIRVRTIMGTPGSGEVLAERFEDGRDNYHQYLSSVHQRTAIDVREMAEAFAGLIENPERRAEMGKAGQARARQLYDWSAIIPQYQALWADQTARRTRDLATSATEPGHPVNPTGIDPFRLYSGYSSAVLGPEAVLSAEAKVSEKHVSDLIKLTGATVIKRMITRPLEVAQIQNAVHDHGPIPYAQFAKGVTAPGSTVEGALLWLLKYDLIQVKM